MSEQFVGILRGKLRFDTAQLAFCAHCSWIGIAKKDRLGVEELHLFYNRHSAPLSPNLLTFRTDTPDGGHERQHHREDHALHIEENDGAGLTCRTAFLDTDVLCCAATLDPDSAATSVKATLLLPASEPRFRRSLVFDASGKRLHIETRLPRTDERDPDPDHALTMSLVIPEAFSLAEAILDGVQLELNGAGAELETDGTLVLRFAAPRDEMLKGEQVFLVGIGEGPAADKMAERVSHARMVTFESAMSASRKWLADALDQFTFDGVPKRLRADYARAAYQTIANTKAPRGQIGRHAAFPSRGTYACHYLWDSCFTSLGAAQFNERLAEDYLIALCESQEPDGKIPHFVCATWNRPGESQPPLIGWSAWRLYERFGNKELIRAIYEPLCRMVEWWFTHRDSDEDGLVEYKHALESGWDDSPRFDKGRIAGVDLNAYLNREMRILAKMAPVLARDHEASIWEQRAAAHDRLIYLRLFDREDGLFYDRLVEEDTFRKVLTPASFAPLWAGVTVPKEAAHRMIAKYLINPRHFFGSRPFPCVAYSDPHYSPGRWWRGPVWPNIAWIMTEVLRIYGFERERREAARRLVEMIVRGGEPNELYSSATGEPLGSSGLGWTCAVLMDLART